MSVDPNCSSRTFQPVSVKTEIVPSCFLLSFAKQEHCEVWHSVNPRKPERFLSKASSNWRKRKECSLRLRHPGAEPFSSARLIPKRSPKLLSWNSTSCRAVLPTRESSCIMTRGVTQLPAAIVLLQGHGHPKPPGQLCSKSAALSKSPRGAEIGLNPSHFAAPPHPYPKARTILGPTPAVSAL